MHYNGQILKNSLAWIFTAFSGEEISKLVLRHSLLWQTNLMDNWAIILIIISIYDGYIKNPIFTM